MIKTIFFDVDGTLVSHTQRALPASAKRSLERLKDFITLTKAIGIQIFDVELDRKRAAGGGVGVVLYLHLPKNQSHTKLLTDLSYSPDVRAIDEI